MCKNWAPCHSALLGNTQGTVMSDATFTFRVDEALRDQFSNAAESRDRTGA